MDECKSTYVIYDLIVKCQKHDLHEGVHSRKGDGFSCDWEHTEEEYQAIAARFKALCKRYGLNPHEAEDLA